MLKSDIVMKQLLLHCSVPLLLYLMNNLNRFQNIKLDVYTCFKNYIMLFVYLKLSDIIV